MCPDEQRLVQLDGFAGDDVACIAEVCHDTAVREHGVHKRALAYAPRHQYWTHSGEPEGDKKRSTIVLLCPKKTCGHIG